LEISYSGNTYIKYWTSTITLEGAVSHILISRTEGNLFAVDLDTRKQNSTTVVSLAPITGGVYLGHHGLCGNTLGEFTYYYIDELTFYNSAFTLRRALEDQFPCIDSSSIVTECGHKYKITQAVLTIGNISCTDKVDCVSILDSNNVQVVNGEISGDCSSGILVDQSSSISLSGITFLNNVAKIQDTSSQMGTLVVVGCNFVGESRKTDPLLDIQSITGSCTIKENTFDAYQAVSVKHASSVILMDNTITNAVKVFDVDVNDVQVVGNFIEGSGASLLSLLSPSGVITGNIIKKATIALEGEHWIVTNNSIEDVTLDTADEFLHGAPKD
jgi:hypothetical protein